MASTAPTSPIAGTWVLTAADKLLPDGTRVSDYGEKPHGLIIFTPDGYYSIQIYRSDRVKFAAGDKTKGAPEEYKDAVMGMSDHYGRYEVDEMRHIITFHVERSSFPNWDDTTRTTPYELHGDVLSWKVQARPDGSIPITVSRRVR